MLRPETQAWQHDHVFDSGNRAAEKGTTVVMWITAATTVVEIVAGLAYNSMALLADGFHMSSHAVAIGISAFAYAAARKHANDRRFAFGTWKIEVLGGFASAIFLLAVAISMVVGSVERLFSPAPIHYLEAMAVAVLGLVVNIVSASILGAAHHHGHGGEDPHHGHSHGHPHGHPHGHAPGHAPGPHEHHHTDDDHQHLHQSGAAGYVHPVQHPPKQHQQHKDLNLQSAYVHVVTDAATSVLAIVALAGGWFYGWSWLDPAMGVVGAALVAVWARRLITDTSRVLLDREMDHPVVDEVRATIESGGRESATQVTDLHVWRVGKASYACAVSVATRDPKLTPDQVRGWIAAHAEVVHTTIEVNLISSVVAVQMAPVTLPDEP